MQSEVKVSKFPLNTCHYLPGEDQVVLGDEEGLVGVWNLEKRGFDFSCYHHKDAVSCSRAFTASSFLTASWDRKVSLWDAERGEVTWNQNHDRMVLGCDGIAPKSLVATACDDTWLRGFDYRTSENVFKIKAHDNSITCVKLTQQEDMMASTSMDMKTRLWDLRTNKLLLNLESHINVVSSCDISPDGRLLVTSSWDKSVKLWDLKAGSFRKQGPTDLIKHEGCVSATHFSENNEAFISSGYDTSVCVWNVSQDSNKPAMVLRGHEAWVKDCCVNRDASKVISIDASGYLFAWDTQNKDATAVYIDQKKNLGLNLVKCEVCRKEFSLSAQEGESGATKLCVFCRMKAPSQTLFAV